MSLRTRSLLAAPASLLALGIVISAAVISVFASTPGDVETHAQQGTGENQLFVPGVVSNAEGTYVTFPTPTPAATSTPTVGIQDAPNRLFVSDATGRNRAPGTRAEPLATIAEALELARDIDDAEVYVATGLYNETITIIDHQGVSCSVATTTETGNVTRASGPACFSRIDWRCSFTPARTCMWKASTFPRVDTFSVDHFSDLESLSLSRTVPVSF